MNVNDNEWISLAQASKDLGFNRNYIQSRILKYKLETKMLDEGMLLKLGHAKFINSKGIEFVQKHVKKLGVHANITTDCVDVYLKLQPLSTLNPA